MLIAGLLAMSLVALADETASYVLPLDESPKPLQVAQRYYRIVDLTELIVELRPFVLDQKNYVNMDVTTFTKGRARSKLGKAGVVNVALYLTPRGGVTPRYRDAHDVTLRAGAEVLQVQEARYEANTSARVPSEVVRFELEGEEGLRRLAEAGEAELTVGPDTLRFQPKQLAAIKDFARYALDPGLAVKPPILDHPRATPAPDRSAIPSGEGVIRNQDGAHGCYVYRDLRSFDQADEILDKPAYGLKALVKFAHEETSRGASVLVPSDTRVKVLGRQERPKSRLAPWIIHILVLDGPHKGVDAWCKSTFVVTSLKEPADRDAVDAEVIWETARSQEESGDRQNALRAYRYLVKELSGTHRAKDAAARIEALSKTKTP